MNQKGYFPGYDIRTQRKHNTQRDLRRHIDAGNEGRRELEESVIRALGSPHQTALKKQRGTECNQYKSEGDPKRNGHALV